MLHRVSKQRTNEYKNPDLAPPHMFTQRYKNTFTHTHKLALNDMTKHRELRPRRSYLSGASHTDRGHSPEPEEAPPQRSIRTPAPRCRTLWPSIPAPQDIKINPEKQVEEKIKYFFAHKIELSNPFII